MLKLVSLSVLLVAFVAESSSQRFIQPTYRPPPGGPVIIRPTYRPPPSRPYIRTVRDVNDEPLWLYKGDDLPRAPSSGDHPFLPTYIDDVHLDPNRRYARSVDSPSARRGGGSHTTSGSSKNTGATHPGYNRRNSRSIKQFEPLEPWRPSPTFPKPIDPFKPVFPGTRRSPYPIYARTAREVHISGLPKKPTHRDVIIPNWNPNARIKPWQTIGVRRNRRSVEMLDEQEDLDSLEY